MSDTVTKRMLALNPDIWGRVKLAQSAPIYRGRWVHLVDVKPEGVSVMISPTYRNFSHDEVERIELNPFFDPDFNRNQARTGKVWLA